MNRRKEKRPRCCFPEIERGKWKFPQNNPKSILSGKLAKEN